MTSFSPVNPGVTVTRPFPELPENPQGPPKSAPNIEALIAASTSCSPANPGATLPLMSALTVPDLGSRTRMLDDIPSIMKRFDVPKANVLTRFNDTPNSTEHVTHPESGQATEKPKTKTLPSSPRHALGSSSSPGFLRPRDGTTYYGTLTFAGETKAVGKPNIFQYILYGNPDPDAKVQAEVKIVEERTVWQSIWRGVPEPDGEKVTTVTEAKMKTIAESNVKAVEDVKEAGGIEAVVAVEKVGTLEKLKLGNAEKVKTSEIYHDVGYGLVAK
ncbi:uncharacterized protein N0V89_001922 [Didymosphaeria variabile]|uniref:Uncharacterized protein n=1 Tax=Didymosphaeria variabile TaxID=1932322 RepID=A0A9W8XTU7_9PLEO|nr:uncharacterized protein N0V89_001922 [Didymosphaeria variabile]KAJ4357347.1 hypothetical protein N0V89_001922 [Didymosphaeria variabile]